MHRDTIMRLGLAWGERAQWLHNHVARDLACSLLQYDEQHSWVHTKEKHVKPGDPEWYGEAWSWVALDAASRFVVSFYVGKRTQESADAFIADVRARLSVVPMIMTSDGLPMYESSIRASFGAGVDYGQVVKTPSAKRRRPDDPPPDVPFMTKRAVLGAPDMDRVSTSYLERQNLTTRHTNGRLRRRCLAFSKTIESHRAAVALNYVAYNYTSVIATSRITPAMGIGVAREPWDVGMLLEALTKAEPCEAPSAKPLGFPAPQTAHRELPNARGYLRAIPGGKAKPEAAPAPLAHPSLRPVPRSPEQLSLFPIDPPKGDGPDRVS